MTSLAIEKGFDHSKIFSLKERLVLGARLARESLRATVRPPHSAETPAILAPGFPTLDALRLELLHSNEPDELKIKLSDTAEHLLDLRLEHESTSRRSNDIGLSVVTSALNAWDTARTPETEELATHLLDEFPGEGWAILNRAFWLAHRDKDLRLSDAQDLAIEQERQKEAA